MLAEQNRNEPLILKADCIRFDEKRNVLSALGHVSLRHSQHHLTTSHADYDLKQKKVSLCRPFCLKTHDGDLLTADSAQLMESLQTGVIQKPRIFTRDRERISALRAIKTDDAQEFEMASYTPCLMCKDQLSPLWSVHARKIVRDEKNQTLDYTDAHLEFAGVPIAYAPHFYFPFKRKTGFLVPYIKSTKELGLFFSLPYYWVIGSSGNRDLTVTPYITGIGGTIIASEYRHALNHGFFSLKGAVNFHSNQYFSTDGLKSTRGYFCSLFKYDISPYWRLDSKEWWVSDATFFSTRPFFENSTAPLLESSTKLEGFYPKSFIQLKELHYQDLQLNESTLPPPVIYPLFTWVYTEPNGIAKTFQRYTIETLSLEQSEGLNKQRVAVEAHVKRPFMFQGHRFMPFLHFEYAFFHTMQTFPEKLKKSVLFADSWKSDRLDQTHNINRFFPQLGLEWDYSWALPSMSLLIVPQIQCIAGLDRINKPLLVGNQDSLGVNFHDAFLFQANRFPGRDLVDEGSRINYAVNFKLKPGSASHTSLMIGQSYAFTNPAKDLGSFGVRKRFSDFVGRVEGFFAPWKSLVVYRFRLNGRSFRSQLQEVFAIVGPKQLNFSGGYTFLAPDPHAVPELVFQGYRQVFGTLNAQITKSWSIKIFMTQNLTAYFQPNKLLDKGFGIAYQDECFRFQLNVQKSFYRLRDLRPGWSIDFNIWFKNLGGLKQKFNRFPRASRVEE